MHNLYQVLGVSNQATDEVIKAAFRTLAKELHPDLHPRDAGAVQRFQNVITAYETLSNAKSRFAYDAGVATQHAQRLRRLGPKAVTMAAAFTLTVCSVSIAVFWSEVREALQFTDGAPPAAAESKPPANNSVEVRVEPSPGGKLSPQPLPQPPGSSDEPDVRMEARIRLAD
jgi:DnaJ-class molecular chaperone